MRGHSMRDLAEVLQEAHEGAENLAAWGMEPRICDVVARFARDVGMAAADFLVWIDETEASQRCGHHVRWLRARFDGWQAAGHAMKVGRRRMYRRIVVPEKLRAAQ